MTEFAQTAPDPAQGKKRRFVIQVNMAVGGVMAVFIVAMVLISLVWTPHSPTRMVVAQRLQGPSLNHWLGTDHFGRDVLSMMMIGAQSSLSVAFISVSLAVLIGGAIGLLASAMRGWVEEAAMRAADFMLAFPAILAAIMLSAALGAGLSNAMAAITLYNIPVFARLVRGVGNTIWARDYVAAAQVAGKSRLSISLLHVLPNVLNPIVVQATISFASAILAEAALSYLGLGAQPPSASWGRMLNDAQPYLYQATYLAVFPGVAIAASVLAFNLLGDGLRDAIDPKMRKR